MITAEGRDVLRLRRAELRRGQVVVAIMLGASGAGLFYEDVVHLAIFVNVVVWALLFVAKAEQLRVLAHHVSSDRSRSSSPPEAVRATVTQPVPPAGDAPTGSGHLRLVKPVKEDGGTM